MKQKIPLDEILDNVVKPSGLWQWTAAFFIAATISAPVLFPVFGNTIPAYRCRMDDDIEDWILNNHNITLSFDQISRTIDSGEGSGCKREFGSWDVGTFLSKLGSTRNQSQLMVPCSQGYIYEYKSGQYPTSIAEEWNLVCDFQWLVPFSASSYMMASVVGLLLGSWAADAYGRKTFLMVSSVTELLCGIGVTFSPNYVIFLLCRIIIGALNTAQIIVSAVIYMELTTPKHRSKFIALWSLFIDLIHPMWAKGLAYLVSNWRWLHAVILFPKLLCLGYFYMISESPHWLISKGRKKEARDVLFKGFCWNNFKFYLKEPECVLEERFKTEMAIYEDSFLDDPNETKELKQKSKKCNIKLTTPALFSNRQLILQTFLTTMVFIGVKSTFFGLIFYANEIRGSIYIIAVIYALAGVPAPIVSILLYRYMKSRKLPLIIVSSIVLSQLLIGSIYTMITNPVIDYCLVACVYIASVLLISMFNMLYVFIPEIFPANVRSQGLGFSTGIGRLGTVASAFINEVDEHLGHGSPLLFYLVLLFIGTICLAFLPDTNGSETSLKDDMDKIDSSSTT